MRDQGWEIRDERSGIRDQRPLGVRDLSDSGFFRHWVFRHTGIKKTPVGYGSTGRNALQGMIWCAWAPESRPGGRSYRCISVRLEDS